MAYPVPQPDPTSVFGRRVLAFLIDLVIIWVPVAVIASADLEYVTATTLEREGVTGEQFCDPRIEQGDICADLVDIEGVEAVFYSDSWSATTQLSIWLIPFALLVVLQAFTGWTPGKVITGIRTVREDGRPPGFVKALLRWLLWIVDAFPYFLPLVGFIVGLTTVGHRRVGDMVAKTFVVRKDAAGSPIVVAGLTPSPSAAETAWAPPPAPSAPGWAGPTSAAPPAATPPPAPVAAAEGPQWDEARGTYIQWDPVVGAWMQWDDGFKTWSRIPGQ